MILHGKQAVAALEKEIGSDLSYRMRRVVMLEGYATEPYRDSKGVLTTGVGQTDEWIQKGFQLAFVHHVERVEERLPDFGTYPEYLQGELIQAEYRGDLGYSPKTIKLIRRRWFREAAEEFLDSNDYRTGGAGIRRRMEAVSLALKLYDLQEQG